MACRKDGKGRVLRKGEGYRKGDGRYSYVYIDPLGKKRTIYAQSLVKLREREEQLQKDQLDGLDVYVAGKADVNFLFDRYISTKTELRSTTYSNYLYTWNHFIRDTFGKNKNFIRKRQAIYISPNKKSTRIIKTLMNQMCIRDR